MARNDITGDSIANTKGSAEKYAQGWEGIFGQKQVVPKLKGCEPSARDTIPRLSCREKLEYRSAEINPLVFCNECDIVYQFWFLEEHSTVTPEEAERIWKKFLEKAEPHELPTTVMALDFHDSIDGLVHTTCFGCGHSFPVCDRDRWAQCPECGTTWEQDCEA